MPTLSGWMPSKSVQILNTFWLHAQCLGLHYLSNECCHAAYPKLHLNVIKYPEMRHPYMGSYEVVTLVMFYSWCWRKSTVQKWFCNPHSCQPGGEQPMIRVVCWFIIVDIKAGSWSMWTETQSQLTRDWGVAVSCTCQWALFSFSVTLDSTDSFIGWWQFGKGRLARINSIFIRWRRTTVLIVNRILPCISTTRNYKDFDYDLKNSQVDIKGN